MNGDNGVTCVPWLLHRSRIVGNELQNFGALERDPLPQFFVNTDSRGVEVEWN